MEYQIVDDDGAPFDAALTVTDGSAILHSRGGTIGSRNERNRDYSKALRLILERLLTRSDSGFSEIVVDSSRVQELSLENRMILTKAELGGSFDSLFTLVSRRMQAVGRSPDVRSARGNSNKRIRLTFPAKQTAQIAQTLGLRVASIKGQPSKRLDVAMLRRVTPEHIHIAIGHILDAEDLSSFGASRRYDLIIDGGVRLPPKAVLGKAATLALGFEVLPEHFSADDDHACFKILRASGYEIVSKGAENPSIPSFTDEDRTWAEGSKTRVSHLRRERSRGAAEAKRAAFRREHGRLFCERCGLDPVKHFGALDGEACIEVHHHNTAIESMDEGHQTSLGDLQCLCANCHRYVHKIMRGEAMMSNAPTEPPAES